MAPPIFVINRQIFASHRAGNKSLLVDLGLFIASATPQAGRRVGPHCLVRAHIRLIAPELESINRVAEQTLN
jgi:hypothetical protein